MISSRDRDHIIFPENGNFSLQIDPYRRVECNLLNSKFEGKYRYYGINQEITCNFKEGKLNGMYLREALSGDISIKITSNFQNGKIRGTFSIEKCDTRNTERNFFFVDDEGKFLQYRYISHGEISPVFGSVTDLIEDLKERYNSSDVVYDEECKRVTLSPFEEERSDTLQIAVLRDNSMIGMHKRLDGSIVVYSTLYEQSIERDYLRREEKTDELMIDRRILEKIQVYY